MLAMEARDWVTESREIKPKRWRRWVWSATSRDQRRVANWWRTEGSLEERVRVEELSGWVSSEIPFNPFIVRSGRVLRVLEEKTRRRLAGNSFGKQGSAIDYRSSQIGWWTVRVQSVWSGGSVLRVFWTALSTRIPKRPSKPNLSKVLESSKFQLSTDFLESCLRWLPTSHNIA